MNIQLNKKTVDIALLCMCAILVFGFSYSSFGLALAFACLCGIIATETWYKKIIGKIDNWCGRHKWFSWIYSGLLALWLFLMLGDDFMGQISNLINYEDYFSFPRMILSGIGIILTVALVGLAVKNKQNSLPRLITYVAFVVFVSMLGFVRSATTGWSITCVLLLIATCTMLYKIKHNKA